MDTAKILTTPEYLKILQDERFITFATFIDGHESHHQISILEYDTKEKIEKKMAETLAQVSEELHNSNNLMRKQPIPNDIQALVNEHIIQEEK